MQSRFSNASVSSGGNANNGGYSALRTERGEGDGSAGDFRSPTEGGWAQRGRPSFDKWWDDLNKKKATPMPSSDLQPPSMRKAPRDPAFGDR